MASIVLVHGAWYGAWCWADVVAALEARGWDVRAPDLPAHGEDRTHAPEVTLAAYAEAVGRALEGLPGPAVVVGHSMAGIVLSVLGEAQPGRVKKLVYLAAYLLSEGQSVSRTARSDRASALQAHLAADEGAGVVALAPEGFAAALASGCSAADIERARSRARPEPLAPLVTPLAITAARWGRVPRSYIRTTRDRTVSGELQRRMLDAIPTETHTLEGGHSPFLSDPGELADLIEVAAR